MITNTDTTAASGAASQPEALRLADMIPRIRASAHPNYWEPLDQIDAELRRLHALTIAAPAAQEAEPAIQWQKRHPDYEDGAWRDCSEGDAKWWQKQNPEWEVRRLSYTPQSARSAPRPQADAGAPPAVPEGWRLMPAKATQEILDAIRRVVDLETSDPEDHRYDDGTSTAGALYEALLAAAPQAPAAPATPNCARCQGSGEDPEGYYDQSKGDAGHTHDGPCRDCSGTGEAPAAPTAAAEPSAGELLARSWMVRPGGADGPVPAPAAGAAPSQHITQPYTVAEIRERIASGDYSADLMLQHAMLHLGAVAGAAPTDAFWWRKRADEIELAVARSGSTQAMRYYTDMRTLLQAVSLRAAAPAQEAAPLTQAAQDVLAERRRQVEAEGRTPEHDDRYPPGTMARAAGCYATINTYPTPTMWPWAPEWWKPRDDRSNYVRAAALLIAELERLDRDAARARQEGGAA